MKFVKNLLWIGIFILLCTACTAITTDPESFSTQETFASYDAEFISVEWEVRNHQDFYQIGDGFRVKLIITNENLFSVSFPGFYFERVDIGFSAPNALHLITPNGEDVMQPYQNLVYLTSHAESITVPAQGVEFFDFTIPQRLQLWVPGTYTLCAELQDEFSTLHHSNQLTFDVVDIEPSINPALIDVGIRFAEELYTQPPDWIEITITNNSDQSLVLVDPDKYGLFQPAYNLIIKDAAGRWLPLPAPDITCEKFYELLKSDHYWLNIDPGSFSQHVVRVPNFVQLSERIPGKYKVQISYRMLPYNLCIGEVMNWSDEVFVGHLESSKIQFSVATTNP